MQIEERETFTTNPAHCRIPAAVCPEADHATFSSSICGVKASRPEAGLKIGSALFRSPSATRQSPKIRRLTALQSSLHNEFAFIVCNLEIMKYPTVPVGADWYCNGSYFNSIERRLSTTNSAHIFLKNVRQKVAELFWVVSFLEFGR